MKFISIGLVFLLLFEIAPLNLAFAEDQEKEITINENVDEMIDDEISEAIIHGKADAEEDVNAMYEAGFCGCPFGVIATKKIELTPKLENLEGKSELYIEAYKKAYNERVIEIQKKDALQCCVSATIVNGAILTIVVLFIGALVQQW